MHIPLKQLLEPLQYLFFPHFGPREHDRVLLEMVLESTEMK
jgi:hypothetical protein